MAVQEGRKKVFWIIVYVFWVLADIEFAWSFDKTHLVFLLLAVFGAVCTCFAELDHAQAWIGSAVAVLAAVIVWMVAPPTHREETEVHWTLLPSNKAAPLTGCSPEVQSDPKRQQTWQFGPMKIPGMVERFQAPAGATIVALGSNGVIVDQSEPLSILTIGTCAALSVHKTQEGLFISASVYDDKSRLITQVKDNAIIGINGDNSQLSREADLTTLSVKNGEDQELLWVSFLNPRSIKVRGVFRCPDAESSVVNVSETTVVSNPIHGNPMMTAAMVDQCVANLRMDGGAPVPPGAMK